MHPNGFKLFMQLNPIKNLISTLALCDFLIWPLAPDFRDLTLNRSLNSKLLDFALEPKICLLKILFLKHKK